MNVHETAASVEIDTLGQKKPTAAELMREAMEGRRQPLRGRELVAIAQKMGLDWWDTGTGWKPGTLIIGRTAKYFVLPTGSFLRVEAIGEQLFRPGRLSKKQRNRLKRTARRRALEAVKVKAAAA